MPRLLTYVMTLWCMSKVNAKTLEVPNAILLGSVRDALHRGHNCIINVRGWSMRPFLYDRRDSVLLAPVSELHVGDAVLAEDHPDHYILHRIIDIQGDSITLMGDGNVSGTENCQRSDIHGVVIKYIHPHYSFRADNSKVIRLVSLWKKLLPIRFYLLKIYSLLHKIHIAQ